MSVYHKADPGELIQWVTHEWRSSAASNSGLIRIETQPRTADAWHQWLMPAARRRHPRFFGHFWPSVWPSSRSNFDLGPSPLESTEKKSLISELMILECSFPLRECELHWRLQIKWRRPSSIFALCMQRFFLVKFITFAVDSFCQLS